MLEEDPINPAESWPGAVSDSLLHEGLHYLIAIVIRGREAASLGIFFFAFVETFLTGVMSFKGRRARASFEGAPDDSKAFIEDFFLLGLKFSLSSFIERATVRGPIGLLGGDLAVSLKTVLLKHFARRFRSKKGLESGRFEDDILRRYPAHATIPSGLGQVGHNLASAESSQPRSAEIFLPGHRHRVREQRSHSEEEPPI